MPPRETLLGQSRSANLLRALARSSSVLVVAIVVNFALPRLAPGSAADYLLAPENAVSLNSAQRKATLQQFGLDKSVSEQFTRYVNALAHGDMLDSVRYGRPVRDLLMERLPWTLLLVGSSLTVAIALGSFLGFGSAWKRGSARDLLTMVLVVLLDSLPVFFVGMMLLFFFSLKLGWFPMFGGVQFGSASTGLSAVGDVAKRLVLPLSTLVLAQTGSIYLVARSAMVSELREDYVAFAVAKGLPTRRVRAHARRNSLLPVVTIGLVSLGTLIGGATVVETVFSYPGVGRLVFDSVLARDYPVIQGVFFALAITVITANLVADLITPLLDRRTIARVDT